MTPEMFEYLGHGMAGVGFIAVFAPAFLIKVIRFLYDLIVS